jgi:small subunit ribosomal protein S16
MSVKIRLSRIGKKNAPFFRIVVIDSRKKRDGAFIEDLGTYDVLEGKMVRFEQDRVDDWVAKGAIVTDAVKKICKSYQKSTQAPSAPASIKKASKKAAVKEEVQVEQGQAQA